jgi:RNA polymerase sigma-70 factor, ECF subfamily
MGIPKDSESCKEVFALLSDYLDLDLPVDVCKEIEDHLAGCPRCIEFVESLRKTIALCRNYRRTELPAPVGEQARAQLLAAYTRMLGSRGSKGE